MGLVSLLVWFLCFLGEVKTIASDHVYDFEESNVPSEITSSSGSLQLDTSQHKHGAKSLKWQWTAGSKLTWDLTSKNIAGNKAKQGGIKLWIRNEKKYPGKCLSFCFSRIKQATGKTGCASLTNNPPTDSCFPFALNFKGWRASYVTYQEFNGCPSPLSGSRPPSPVYDRNCYIWKITKLTVAVSAGITSPSPLYLDIFRFVDNLAQYWSTRDATVPPLIFKDSSGNKKCTSCNKIYDTSNGIKEADVLARHSRKSHWQQIYRWSLLISPVTPATVVHQTKFANLNLITQRLINWYANEQTSFSNAQSSNYFVRERWEKLLRIFERAKTTNGNLNARGLFSARSDIPGRDKTKTFSWMFQSVLLPLSLSHYIESRPHEVNEMACKKAKEGQCSGASRAASSPPPPCDRVTIDNFYNCKAIITNANDAKKRTILQLFDYLNDQGIQAGSGLGVIDFQGLGMSGFMHSAFLMRKELEAANKLDGVISTMKWYNYFGEVYQKPFDYKGSSADAIRTEMLSRLLTVLTMPENTAARKIEKIRDMDALKLWIENALTINEGLEDFIKPDFTTYHHKTFYGSAYCASALHIASLVSYLFQGTEFQIEDGIRKNLVKALEVFRTTAVRYSTPSAIGGRFPKYDREILAEHVQAYAYLAAKPPNTATNILRDTALHTDAGVVGMFLRLYSHVGNTCTGKLNEQLCKGSVKRIYYLNTLGSLEIMDKVKTLASGNKNPELSPSGHWFKPFAGLSIHRRNDWAVTVKGFNKYIWDYEQGSKENLYGMYASHGSMLIANSESALSSKNVDKGWEWRKIPGTTAINLAYSQMLHTDHRWYNNKRNSKNNLWDTMPTMAGGVSLMGSNQNSKLRNGVFGMDFIQPTYKPPTPGDFRFKKSVFFYDDMIVLLGSNIQCNGCNKEVHTALFQDQMQSRRSATPAVQDEFRCNDVGSPNYRKDSWGSKTLVKLVDVHGNRYYIPNPDQQGLVFTRKKAQTSFKSKGKNKPSTGIYCTAWLNHGKGQTLKSDYQYLVQVETEPSGASRKPVLTPSAVYTVIQQDDKAHVVKFPTQNSRGDVYGYVVFPKRSKVSFGTGHGPLAFVRRQSIIMVEKTSQNLFISVAHPDLNLRRVPGSPSWCNDKSGDAPPIRFDDAGNVLRYCAKSSALTIPVKPREDWRTLNFLRVNGEDKMKSKDDYLSVTKKKVLRFTNLRNSYVTEVKYTK